MLRRCVVGESLNREMRPCSSKGLGTEKGSGVAWELATSLGSGSGISTQACARHRNQEGAMQTMYSHE